MISRITLIERITVEFANVTPIRVNQTLNQLGIHDEEFQEKRVSGIVGLVSRELRSRGERLRWITQDKFGGVEGNCLASCVASILKLPLEDIPNFCHKEVEDWFSLLREFLVPHGFVPLLWDLQKTIEEGEEVLKGSLPRTLSIVSGKSERGLLHATVWWGGEMVHDPHPSRAGLLEVSDVIVFVARL